jgi:hypothetical protein
VEALSAPPAAEPDALLIAEDAPRCPEHPTLPAAGTCSRCGAFYCIRCVPEAAQVKQAMCPRCQSTQAVREAPEKIRGLFRELWISPLVMGVGVLLSFVALGLSGRGAEMIGGAVIGVIASLPFFVVALLLGLTRSIAVAWVGFVLELLMLLMMLLGGVSCFVLVMAIVPVMTVLQISKVRELQALLKAQPAEQSR